MSKVKEQTMETRIVRTPVLNADGNVIAPTGTVLTDDVLESLALEGVDLIDTYTGTLRYVE